MFCTKCGMYNPDSVAFCSSCGAALAGKPASAEPPKAEPQIQAQPQQPQTPYQQPQTPYQQPENAPSPESPKKKGSGGKIALILIIAVLILGLIGGGVYYFFLRDKDDSSADTESTSAQSTDDIEDEESSEDETDDSKETEDDTSSDDPKPSEDKNAEEVIDIITESVEALHSYGSWSEECIMDYVISAGGQKVNAKSEVLASVYNYDEDDLDDLRMVGSGRIETQGVVQEWTYTYEDGKATYHYTKPSESTSTVDMDPSFFSTSLKKNMIKDCKIKGETVTFVIDGKAAKDALNLVNSTLGNETGLESIEYSDIEVKFKYDEDTGVVKTYDMEFSAEFTVSGQTMSADYDIDYSFEVLDDSDIVDTPVDVPNTPVTPAAIHSSPEILAEYYLRSSFNFDFEAMLECFPHDFVDAYVDKMYNGDRSEFVAEVMESADGLSIEATLDLEVSSTDEYTAAKVKTLSEELTDTYEEFGYTFNLEGAGKVVFSATVKGLIDGEEVNETNKMTVEVVKIDGKWFLNPDEGSF